VKSVQLATTEIRDWSSFHETFAKLFGFPGFYGANMDAWIDCMSYLDDPDAAMSSLHLEPNEALTIEVCDTEDFQKRCPDQFAELVTCTSFVNQRFLRAGSGCRISLLFL
jgi:RNAse (barnase) inhibitor barstar